MEFAEASFDLITLWAVLEHLLDPAEEIGRAVRLLRPGGYLFLQFPNIKSLAARVYGTNWRLNLNVLPQFTFQHDGQLIKATLDNSVGTFTVQTGKQSYTLTKVRTLPDKKPNTAFCDFTLENDTHSFATCHYFDDSLVYFYDGQCFEYGH